MTQQTDIQFLKPRRRDLAIQDGAWIRTMLTRCPVGTLATIGPNGPSIHANLFVFDPQTDTIYLHTARKGETRSNVESRRSVAFCVSEMGRLMPAEAAVDFSVEYSSVVVEGTSKVVHDPDEAHHALDLLMRKYAPHLEPGHDYRGISSSDLARTSVFRIDIESWTGKGKTSDSPDAYHYPQTDEAGNPGTRDLTPPSCPLHNDRGHET